MDFSPLGLFGGIVFGAVGFAAWRVGRKRQSAGKMGLGAALLIFPWFVDDTVWLWVVGGLLSALLFVVP